MLLVVFIILAIAYYKNTNYKTYDLQVERSYFPEVKTAADIEALAKNLVSEMTFEEKVDQMYGEKKVSPCKNWLLIFSLLNGFHIFIQA